MKRLYDAAAAVRSALLCQSGGSSNHRISTRVAQKLDPIVRDALAETLKENDCQAELDELEAEMARVKSNMQQAVEKEQFLGLRSRHYRQALDKTARVLQNERAELNKEESNKGHDEEGYAVYQRSLSEWEARMEKWEKDQDALKSIQATHTQILATIEEMRRTIRKLEEKKKALHKVNEKCQEFVSVAAVAAAANNANNDVGNHATNEDEVDVELTPAGRDGPASAETADEEVDQANAKDRDSSETPLQSTVDDHKAPETGVKNDSVVDQAVQER